MLGAICNKLEYAGAVALISVLMVLTLVAYALCFVNGSLGPSRSPFSTAKRNMLGAKNAQIS